MKKTIMLAATAMAAVSLAGITVKETLLSDTNAKAVEQTSTLRLATITFGTNESDTAHPLSKGTSLSSIAILDGITDSEVTLKKATTASKMINHTESIALGKDAWNEDYGEFVLSFTNFDYRSVIVSAKSNSVGATLTINNQSYATTASYSDIKYRLDSCSSVKSNIKIGNKMAVMHNNVTYVSKITFCR